MANYNSMKAAYYTCFFKSTLIWDRLFQFHLHLGTCAGLSTSRAPAALHPSEDGGFGMTGGPVGKGLSRCFEAFILSISMALIIHYHPLK